MHRLMERVTIPRGFDFYTQNDGRTFNDIVHLARGTVPPCDEAGTLDVTYCIVYWGGTDGAVHEWFVENVMGGVDDGGEYEVGLDALTDLRDTCVEALKTHDSSLIPSRSLDGVTNEYWEGLRETAEKLTEIIGLGTGWYFYQASYAI